MKTRILLGIGVSFMLVSCAIKIPPFGSGILSDAARAQIPGNWSGGHRSGAVVPGWIRTFGDPELTALVEEAIIRASDHVIDQTPNNRTFVGH